MKKFLRIIAKTVASILVIAIATSIVGAAITGARSTAVNTKKGKITNEELRAFFNENRALLLDIATQIISLHKETELYLVRKQNSEIVATDGIVGPVSLDKQLIQQFELYFSAVGTNNDPKVSVREVDGYFLVNFTFQLSVDHSKGIMYVDSTEAQEDKEDNWGIELLDKNWYVFDYLMPAPPTEIYLRWWQKLPMWIQWLLRYICFGWAWMK